MMSPERSRVLPATAAMERVRRLNNCLRPRHTRPRDFTHSGWSPVGIRHDDRRPGIRGQRELAAAEHSATAATRLVDPDGRRRPRTTQDGGFRTGAGNVASLHRPVEVITAMARSVAPDLDRRRAAKPDKRRSTGVYGRLPLRPRTVRGAPNVNQRVGQFSVPRRFFHLQNIVDRNLARILERMAVNVLHYPRE